MYFALIISPCRPPMAVITSHPKQLRSVWFFIAQHQSTSTIASRRPEWRLAYIIIKDGVCDDASPLRDYFFHASIIIHSFWPVYEVIIPTIYAIATAFSTMIYNGGAWSFTKKICPIYFFFSITGLFKFWLF